VKSSLAIEDLSPVRTQQEVALIMGISRARVCQYERSAMRRLQKCLHLFHPGAGAAAVVAPRMRRSWEREHGSGLTQCGWFRVTKLTGKGIFPPAAVCFAFNELRLIHEEYYRPPIVIGNQVGYISAAAMDEGNLSVGVWLAGLARSRGRLGSGSVALEVVILHDVPVIAAGVVETEPLQEF
jgi:hypothetical protein